MHHRSGPCTLLLAATLSPMGMAVAKSPAPNPPAAAMHAFVDHLRARNPRWGRVVEGAGEEPYLGTAMARAVARIPGRRPCRDRYMLLVTARHFVGYGAGERGRDYNSAFLPQGLLHDVYLPPFRTLVEGGIGAVMPALTALNGISGTADRLLLTGLLRQHWGSTASSSPTSTRYRNCSNTASCQADAPGWYWPPASISTCTAAPTWLNYRSWYAVAPCQCAKLSPPYAARFGQVPTGPVPGPVPLWRRQANERLTLSARTARWRARLRSSRWCC